MVDIYYALRASVWKKGKITLHSNGGESLSQDILVCHIDRYHEKAAEEAERIARALNLMEGNRGDEPV